MLTSLSRLRVWCCLSLLVVPLVLAQQSLAQDAPEDWQWSVIAPLASQSLLLDGAAVDDFMVVVGERGHVLLSADRGSTWEQVSVPTRATLTAVFFADRNNGWAVGHDAVIIKTADGGATWARVHFAPEEERPLLDVWFADPSNGIAIGAYGYFLETSDGGETWEPRFFEVASDDAPDDEAGPDQEVTVADMMDFLDDEDPISDLHLNDIRSAPDGTLFIAAEAGHVFRSDDAGETWRELTSPYEGSFYGTLPLGDEMLLLFGLRGNLFYSADGGDSWERVDAGSDAILMGGGLTDAGTIVVTGLGGALLIADDPGEGAPDFSLIQQENRKALATLLSGSDGQLVLIGENGVNVIATGQTTSGGEAP